ncbi:ABC transporter permease [Sphaerisporangium krabiense]|uniref:ABC transporter permease n=1 Tax=Sphaerisporangium krabiense TaxID=763782 RepID=A0A7W8ZC18_9ACTN|nr:ABC transporter permease [Sphaerisporangium krabiense]MBB5631257.1 hypothetical protein [Sphaerisporangium krabiense]GII61130.1 ABC transporter permease [Sphaerisporangium krabiense]
MTGTDTAPSAMREMGDAAGAEWVKLRSVRSTYYVLGVALLIVALTALLSLQAVSAWDAASPELRARWRGITAEEYFLPFVQLVIGVLGVLTITSEYASGMVGAALLAVPRRGRLLAAKAVVLAAVSFAAGVVVLSGVAAAAGWVRGDRPIPGFEASFTQQVPLLVCMGLSVTVVALVAFGLATLTRSTAGAVVAVAGLTFVLPTLALGFLPEPWNVRLARILPANLPDQLAGVAPDPDIPQGPFARSGGLPPLAALAVAVAYVVVTLGAAAVAFSRRDP